MKPLVQHNGHGESQCFHKLKHDTQTRFINLGFLSFTLRDLFPDMLNLNTI